MSRYVPEPPFEVHLTHHGASSILSLSGEFDLAAAQEVRDRLQQLRLDEPRALVLDMRDISFIDSSGIRVILEIWNDSRQNGFSLGVVPGDRVRSVLQVVQLEDELPLLDEVPGETAA
jgi:anti-anti-sigma factor